MKFSVKKIYKYVSRRYWDKIRKNIPAKANPRLTKPDPQMYNQIVRFAENFPVNTIKYGDEHLWPYLRNHLLVQLTALSIGKIDGATTKPSRLHLGTTENFDIDKKHELAKEYGFQFVEDIDSNEEVDFLFFTALNASEQVHVEKKIYYRVTDPVFEAAKRLSSAKKIELIRNISPAIKKTPNYYHRPDFIFSPHIKRIGYSDSINIKSNFFRYFRRFFPLIDISPKIINDLFDWELHTRDFYKDILLKVNPKVVFVPSFHYHAPLISAAKELGILTVDIQHGIQVGYNPLYNNWEEIPSEGYRSLPHVFMVWGQKEADNISKVFGKHSTAVKMGEPWVQKQFEFNVPISEKLMSRISRHSHVILLAMQSQTEVPTLFKTLISKGGKDILWLVRMHPKGKRYSVADFDPVNKNVVVSKEVDDIPLVSLLQYADFTLSEGSSIAAEGATLGVTALISSETGKQNYESEVKQGTFKYIHNLDSFKAAIDEDIGVNSGKNYTNEIALDAVLSDLLAIQKKQQHGDRVCG
ncbi:hypothetical protein PsAD2_04186 [Pseudovibrio axinellae]|uniref:Uncharacterized protein n=1 Tax=Pseudovibrio axinellae TaxID=989403 RepID=A0A165TXH5_9HYPH|nr:hypothetical protein [Pseudovibrio axinellae]KZL07214.1 hypothetical protein PsAD2_04186 [Pseudovibrio axinellae]SER83897.1 hypothetical protein SAMN05421798_1332 [Pseudovibrio axinellae]